MNTLCHCWICEADLSCWCDPIEFYLINQMPKSKTIFVSSRDMKNNFVNTNIMFFLFVFLIWRTKWFFMSPLSGSYFCWLTYTWIFVYSDTQLQCAYNSEKTKDTKRFFENSNPLITNKIQLNFLLFHSIVWSKSGHHNQFFKLRRLHFFR